MITRWQTMCKPACSGEAARPARSLTGHRIAPSSMTFVWCSNRNILPVRRQQKTGRVSRFLQCDRDEISALRRHVARRRIGAFAEEIFLGLLDEVLARARISHVQA